MGDDQRPRFSLERMVGPTTFWSMKIRAFKLSSLEDICEDYEQVATYLGTILDHPNQFPWTTTTPS